MNGEDLREELDRLGESQKGFAERIGWSPGKLNHWITGYKKKLSVQEEKAIRQGLDALRWDKDQSDAVARPAKLRLVEAKSLQGNKLFECLRAAIQWGIEFGQGPGAGIKLTDKDARYLAHHAVTVLLREGDAASTAKMVEQLHAFGDTMVGVSAYDDDESEGSASR